MQFIFTTAEIKEKNAMKLFTTASITASIVMSTVQSASALSPAHPSCISFLQTITEANKSGMSASEIRHYIDIYKEKCSDGVERTEVNNAPKSRPIVEKMVNGVLTITNEGS
jgi:hypothetical protein